MSSRPPDDAKSGGGAKNPAKNPLLSNAITGITVDEYMRSAVLVPAPPSEGKDMLGMVAPESHPFPLIPTPPIDNPEVSNAPKTDDDFDVNTYLERLRVSRYVSAPKTAEPPIEQPHPDEEFSDINLDTSNEDEASEQKGIASDLAQNISQLPQVLPQVASVVFGSFSNILRGQTSVSHTERPYAEVATPQVPLAPVAEEAPADPVPLFDPFQYRNGQSNKAGAIDAGNHYRISTRQKKTYAQIPGLRLGEIETVTPIQHQSEPPPDTTPISFYSPSAPSSNPMETLTQQTRSSNSPKFNLPFSNIGKFTSAVTSFFDPSYYSGPQQAAAVSPATDLPDLPYQTEYRTTGDLVPKVPYAPKGYLKRKTPQAQLSDQAISFYDPTKYAAAVDNDNIGSSTYESVAPSAPPFVDNNFSNYPFSNTNMPIYQSATTSGLASRSSPMLLNPGLEQTLTDSVIPEVSYQPSQVPLQTYNVSNNEAIQNIQPVPQKDCIYPTTILTPQSPTAPVETVEMSAEIATPQSFETWRSAYPLPTPPPIVESDQLTQSIECLTPKLEVSSNPVFPDSPQVFAPYSSLPEQSQQNSKIDKTESVNLAQESKSETSVEFTPKSETPHNLPPPPTISNLFTTSNTEARSSRTVLNKRFKYPIPTFQPQHSDITATPNLPFTAVSSQEAFKAVASQPFETASSQPFETLSSQPFETWQFAYPITAHLPPPVKSTQERSTQSLESNLTSKSKHSVSESSSVNLDQLTPTLNTEAVAMQPFEAVGLQSSQAVSSQPFEVVSSQLFEAIASNSQLPPPPMVSNIFTSPNHTDTLPHHSDISMPTYFDNPDQATLTSDFYKSRRCKYPLPKNWPAPTDHPMDNPPATSESSGQTFLERPSPSPNSLMTSNISQAFEINGKENGNRDFNLAPKSEVFPESEFRPPPVSNTQPFESWRCAYPISNPPPTEEESTIERHIDFAPKSECGPAFPESEFRLPPPVSNTQPFETWRCAYPISDPPPPPMRTTEEESTLEPVRTTEEESTITYPISYPPPPPMRTTEKESTIERNIDLTPKSEVSPVLPESEYRPPPPISNAQPFETWRCAYPISDPPPPPIRTTEGESAQLSESSIERNGDLALKPEAGRVFPESEFVPPPPVSSYLLSSSQSSQQPFDVVPSQSFEEVSSQQPFETVSSEPFQTESSQQFDPVSSQPFETWRCNYPIPKNLPSPLRTNIEENVPCSEASNSERSILESADLEFPKCFAQYPPPITALTSDTETVVSHPFEAWRCVDPVPISRPPFDAEPTYSDLLPPTKSTVFDDPNLANKTDDEKLPGEVRLFDSSVFFRDGAAPSDQFFRVTRNEPSFFDDDRRKFDRDKREKLDRCGDDCHADYDTAHNRTNRVLSCRLCSESMAEDTSEGVLETIQDLGQGYIPVSYHWFYRKDDEGRSIWRPMSCLDSKALEKEYQSPNLGDSTVVSTDGGRFDVHIKQRKRVSVYWNEKPSHVRRCSWFYKGSVDAKFVPYPESIADSLEAKYKQCTESGEWHQKVELPDGESVMLHSADVIIHFLQHTSPDSWGSAAPPTATRPRVVKRGLEDLEPSDGEPALVDHLLLLVHGVGSVCDLRFRTVEEVVDEFRAISLQLVQSHYKSAYEDGTVGRIEVLPISWHSSLHSDETGIDKQIEKITLESIPRLRNFTNDTLLDILFYTSPVFCQSIMNTVGNELNRIYSLFKQRNPSFKGAISLGGHSLGSLILFDLLCHQKPSEMSSQASSSNLKEPSTLGETKAKYMLGAAGTGQPFITYPNLDFNPCALFALGSPIGMFECVRGIDTLGENFALPTCPAFFNIFHPYDPVAYRIEPLVHKDLTKVKPYLIPHHKGRKRMHLELKETMARFGTDIRQRFVESIRGTLSAVYSATLGKPATPPPHDLINKVVEEHLSQEDTFAEQSSSHTNNIEQVPASQYSSERYGKLNKGRRVDFVLQEAPFEVFNEYIFAMASHLCYWESEDTMLLILREIYDAIGVSPDSRVPQPTMTVEVERPVADNHVTSDKDSKIACQVESPKYPVKDLPSLTKPSS